MAAAAAGLQDRIILVTGAAGTLGQAIAGAIESAEGKPIRTDLGTRGDTDLALDVTSEDAWRAAIGEIGRRYGRLDGLVNRRC